LPARRLALLHGSLNKVLEGRAGLCWHNGVSERAQSIGTVHEGGSPINASTKHGLRAPCVDPASPAVSV
jgi:hypothetical protein